MIRDYLKANTLPVGTNRWLNQWRNQENLAQAQMSLFALKGNEFEGSRSRFIIFVSPDDTVAGEIEETFLEWMDNPERTPYFECQLVDRKNQNLPESNENSIIVSRRSRIVKTMDILPHFQEANEDILTRDLLRSLWQILSLRASKATGQQTIEWDFFTKQRLVPSIYLPPDSTVGTDNLKDSIVSVVKTVLHHRDMIWDDYAVFAATNELFQAPSEYTRAKNRTEILRNQNPDQLVADILESLKTHWHI